MSQTVPASSVQETIAQINNICQKSEGVYRDYTCMTVSWNDVSRFKSGSALSCVGSNINDTRLYDKSGALLYVVRPSNWNEKIGRVSSDQIALHASSGDPMTLRHYLRNLGKHCAYIGVGHDVNLSDDRLDNVVGIRFQTCFLP